MAGEAKPKELTPDARPRLAGFLRMQFDAARGNWILQAPERVLVLDEISKEIIERCTGSVSIAEVAGGLAEEYDAPHEMILKDVLAVLGLLREKGFLELEAEGKGGL